MRGPFRAARTPADTSGRIAHPRFRNRRIQQSASTCLHPELHRASSGTSSILPWTLLRSAPGWGPEFRPYRRPTGLSCFCDTGPGPRSLALPQFSFVVGRIRPSAMSSESSP
jgi:hypothetical protein